jgi:hypothetical protein
VTGVQLIIGAKVSITVIALVHVDVFPAASVTVSVTELTPRSAQVNVDCDTLIVNVQLSVLPSLIMAAVKLAVPEAFKYNVSALQCATGAIVSTTVTTAEQVDVFPAASVAVKVTVFAPASAQVNNVSVIVTVTEQLSVLPLSMSAATSLASPFVSK